VSKPFRVVYADPAWSFKDRLPGVKRGAAKHYRVISQSEIMRFPLPPIAADAWLFMWRVHTHQREALQVIEAWGFKYASEMVWVKTAKNGRPRMGMGHTIRQSHEVCIVARRGRPEQLSRGVGSVILAPRHLHSVKPAEMYDRIEQFAPGPYVELFARSRRPGWESIGDEVPEAAE
jgi:N6-adenosine-specific RNA methylase IME4